MPVAPNSPQERQAIGQIRRKESNPRGRQRAKQAVHHHGPVRTNHAFHRRYRQVSIDTKKYVAPRGTCAAKECLAEIVRASDHRGTGAEAARLRAGGARREDGGLSALALHCLQKTPVKSNRCERPTFAMRSCICRRFCQAKSAWGRELDAASDNATHQHRHEGDEYGVTTRVIQTCTF
jgi:hypothetical protein